MRVRTRVPAVSMLTAVVCGAAAVVPVARAAPQVETPSKVFRVTAEEQRQLVPAYFAPTDADDPDNPWHRMCSRMKGGSIAVMNPGSGPGTKTKKEYTDAISYCQLWFRRQRVIGYVYTDYTNRRLNDVIADINTYYRLYPNLDGIFVDEMANDPDGVIAVGGMTVKTYYGRIYRHVRLKGTTANPEVVVGNPGRPASTAWQLDAPVADKVVVFEGFQERYETWTPQAWVHARPASRIVQLVHSAPSAQRHRVCQLSRARNAGFIYVTDDVLDNPWNRLPTYWFDVAPTCK